MLHQVCSKHHDDLLLDRVVRSDCSSTISVMHRVGAVSILMIRSTQASGLVAVRNGDELPKASIDIELALPTQTRCRRCAWTGRRSKRWRLRATAGAITQSPVLQRISRRTDMDRLLRRAKCRRRHYKASCGAQLQSTAGSTLVEDMSSTSPSSDDNNTY